MCAIIQLCLNLHAILKGEYQPLIVVGCGLLHHRQPEGVVELLYADFPFMHREHKTANEVGFGLPLPFLLLEGICPGLGFSMSCHIAIVVFCVFLLTLRTLGVLLGASLGQLRQHCDLLEKYI